MDVPLDKENQKIPDAEEALAEVESDLERLQPDQARLDRIAEYQTQALGLQDLLLANLGSLNSGQMRIALHLEGVIERQLASGKESSDQHRNVLPVISTYLHVTRQVDRYARFGQQFQHAPSKPSATAPGTDVPEERSEKSENSKPQSESSPRKPARRRKT